MPASQCRQANDPVYNVRENVMPQGELLPNRGRIPVLAISEVSEHRRVNFVGDRPHGTIAQDELASAGMGAAKMLNVVGRIVTTRRLVRPAPVVSVVADEWWLIVAPGLARPIVLSGKIFFTDHCRVAGSIRDRRHPNLSADVRDARGFLKRRPRISI